MAKLVWRVKLVAELGSGMVSEAEVARIERDDFAVAETVGLTLDEGKRLAAATQAHRVAWISCGCSGVGWRAVPPKRRGRWSALHPRSLGG